ncbi:MAG: DUF1007 family protein [Campylobacteraceae bacterium]|mgnify:FL=1|jgi:ABC-type uncharacterized transport system substrate-binding protein|nr:DUF1007 family protein [Campylobacteraceae bacterium]MBT3881787.1 DUF1007 family protein [Campylobacteraceae bacterium]MBT4031030.1 DUF1007 family protein [Campylobacteraceae bacterium]MBT4179768.1 DUF1007 family protein [Campylobacteraceae bacterium]MBT4573075.1 DUF1007 family protein [Campylobacteraceae bacterium]
MIKKIPLMILLYVINLFAHPHTFIEIYPTIEVKNNQTNKINFKWVLDEMTSSMLIMEFDQNSNNKIDEDENIYILDNYFAPLKDYNFYTNIRLNDKIQFFPKTTNFKATIEENRICYYFDIQEKYNIKDVKFDFGDEDFFVAMVLKKEFIEIIGAQAKIIDLDNDFYFGYRLELK